MWPFRRKQSAVERVVIDPFRHDPVAHRVREAMTARDWDTVRRVFGEPLADHRRSFYLDIAAESPGVRDWIDDVIRAHPDETLPLLVRGVNFIDWAWELRGSGYSNTVAEDKWATIRKRLKLAEDSFDEAVALDPKCVDALEWLIVLANSRSLGQAEKWRRFEALIAVAPAHPAGHSAMLQAVAPKWGGSIEEMFRYARERAATGPGTSLPSLIAKAHLEEWLRRDDGNEYMERPEVGEELAHAAAQSIWHLDFDGDSVGLHNTFGYAFALADRFAEAERCFALIGDDHVTRQPWSYGGRPEEVYPRMRDYVRSRLDG